MIRNGFEALGYINKTGSYANKPTPDLILLDINMPLINGLVAPSAIMQTDGTTHTPIQCSQPLLHP